MLKWVYMKTNEQVNADLANRANDESRNVSMCHGHSLSVMVGHGRKGEKKERAEIPVGRWRGGKTSSAQSQSDFLFSLCFFLSLYSLAVVSSRFL